MTPYYSPFEMVLIVIGAICFGGWYAMWIAIFVYGITSGWTPWDD